jgi:hypothetical protein
MKTIAKNKGEAVVLLCMLRNVNGQPALAADGTFTATLARDFTPFTAVNITGTAPVAYNPPKGTLSLPDSRWIPGIDGDAGFNVECVIPSSHFSQAGTYFATLQFTGLSNYVDSETFRIHIGS